MKSYKNKNNRNSVKVSSAQDAFLSEFVHKYFPEFSAPDMDECPCELPSGISGTTVFIAALQQFCALRLGKHLLHSDKVDLRIRNLGDELFIEAYVPHSEEVEVVRDVPQPDGTVKHVHEIKTVEKRLRQVSMVSGEHLNEFVVNRTVWLDPNKFKVVADTYRIVDDPKDSNRTKVVLVLK